MKRTTAPPLPVFAAGATSHSQQQYHISPQQQQQVSSSNRSRNFGLATTAADHFNRKEGGPQAPMGNTSASQKDSSANAPRAAKNLNELLPALRERFEELAGLPVAAITPAVLAGTTTRGTETYPRQDSAEKEKEHFILFGDWRCHHLPGPRGAKVAKRLYSVLDANGDGKLNFEEFASAACLLKGSPDENKFALLFNMYGDASRGGLVGSDGLKAFILDMIAASPPLLAPPALGVVDGRTNGASVSWASWAIQQQQQQQHQQQQQPDLEKELDVVLTKMAGVVLSEYDADKDGLLMEKEWKAYLKREEESVSVFLMTLSDSVGKFLLPP